MHILVGNCPNAQYPKCVIVICLNKCTHKFKCTFIFKCVYESQSDPMIDIDICLMKTNQKFSTMNYNLNGEKAIVKIRGKRRN